MSILNSITLSKKKSNLILIAPLSLDENHFFLTNCLADENVIAKTIIEATNTGFILLKINPNEFDWFNYFWNGIFNEENKIQSFHQSTDCENIFTRFFGLDEELSKHIQFNFTILIKDITKLNSLVAKIESKVEILWTNFDKYLKNKNRVNTDWRLVTIPFLNDLYYEQYPRVTYLVLNEEQKEEEYYILNQSFRSQQNLLIVELDKEDFLPKYRQRQISLTQKHSYHFFAENEIDVLSDFDVYIFENYNNWEKKYDELFMIRPEDYNSLLTTISNTNNRYCYRWIDETIFINKYKSLKFEILGNSLWHQKYLYGIIVKKHDYHQRSSDFGSDNSLIIAVGDSRYLKVSQALPLHVYHYPRGFSSDGKECFVDYDMMGTNIYAHFYQNKKLVLINFDEGPQTIIKNISFVNLN